MSGGNIHTYLVGKHELTGSYMILLHHYQVASCDKLLELYSLTLHHPLFIPLSLLLRGLVEHVMKNLGMDEIFI